MVAKYVTSVEKARRLRQQEAEIARGPRLSADGQFVELPSPRYNPDFAACLKRLGGRFQPTTMLYHLWLVPATRITLEEANQVYRQHYAAEVAASERRLANCAWHDRLNCRERKRSKNV